MGHAPRNRHHNPYFTMESHVNAVLAELISIFVRSPELLENSRQISSPANSVVIEAAIETPRNTPQAKLKMG